MQPRGATTGTKRARQYGRIKDGELERSASESRAEEIPRVPDEGRARASPASARGTSTEDISSPQWRRRRTDQRAHEPSNLPRQALGLSGPPG